MSRFYITTAIDYANGDPHIGHAYERFGADAIARYRRLRGDDVHFLIGMDEHGQKVAQTAEAEGVTPQALADRIATLFRGTWDRIGISYDQFVRTTEPAHKAGVRALIERIYARNPDDLYEKEYQGLYCVGCELFKREAEIVDGRCAIHPTRILEEKTERNWFFRLSRYGGFLRKLNSRPGFMEPEARRNEILSLIDSGLDDISVTRARLSWGSLAAAPQHRRDAGHPGSGSTPCRTTSRRRVSGGRLEARWPAQLHVVGKDITRLHAVIWPAMLESAGLAIPGRVWAHGFALFKGEKVSKSSGVAFSLNDAIDRHGPDAVRYFLLREIPWDADGTYTWERFDERYTADLADAFGNLASRVLAMLERYRQGVVPAAPPTELDAAADDAVRRYAEAMDALLLHKGAAAAWDIVTAANGYVDRRAPGHRPRPPASRGSTRRSAPSRASWGGLCLLASPFVPGAAATLWQALGPGRSAPAPGRVGSRFCSRRRRPPDAPDSGTLSEPGTPAKGVI